MRIISRSSKAASSAVAWFNAYFDKGRWIYGEDKRLKWEALKALGDKPNPDDVDRVIGNPTWTSTRCDECGTLPEVVVMVGDEPDYESNTVHLCTECIIKLRAMV